LTVKCLGKIFFPWEKSAISIETRTFSFLQTSKDTKSDFGDFDIFPDGTKVVFTGEPQDHYEKPAIYVFNLENNSVSLLHQEGGVRSCWNPVWSKDDRQILFSYSIPDDVLGSEVSLKIMNGDGTNVRRVFKAGIFHDLINGIWGAVPEQKEYADWWQP
jgi:hypothetical protein